MVRKNDLPAAAKVIAEARTIAAFLTETERGKCGGDVDLAIHRVSMFCGIEEGALRSLRYRWRELRDIKASLLERLREAYEDVYERQRRQSAIDREINEAVSRGGAGGAQEEGAVPVAAPSTPSVTTSRATISRADDAPAKQQRNTVAEF